MGELLFPRVPKTRNPFKNISDFTLYDHFATRFEANLVLRDEEDLRRIPLQFYVPDMIFVQGVSLPELEGADVAAKSVEDQTKKVHAEIHGGPMLEKTKVSLSFPFHPLCSLLAYLIVSFHFIRKNLYIRALQSASVPISFLLTSRRVERKAIYDDVVSLIGSDVDGQKRALGGTIVLDDQRRKLREN